MRRVVWRSEAKRDYREAVLYFADRDASSARSLTLKIETAIIRLAQHSTGRPGRVPDVFEKPISGTFYTLAYAVADDELYILRLIHQRREWLPGLWPIE